MRRPFHLPPQLQYTIIKLLFFIGILPPILLFEWSHVLGFWWFVLMLLYLAALIAGYGAIMRKRDMSWLLHELGEEQFLQAFPAERRRRARLAAREARRRQREEEAARRRKERELAKRGL